LENAGIKTASVADIKTECNEFPHYTLKMRLLQTSWNTLHILKEIRGGIGTDKEWQKDIKRQTNIC